MTDRKAVLNTASEYGILIKYRKAITYDRAY